MVHVKAGYEKLYSLDPTSDYGTEMLAQLNKITCFKTRHLVSQFELNVVHACYVE